MRSCRPVDVRGTAVRRTMTELPYHDVLTQETLHESPQHSFLLEWSCMLPRHKVVGLEETHWSTAAALVCAEQPRSTAISRAYQPCRPFYRRRRRRRHCVEGKNENMHNNNNNNNKNSNRLKVWIRSINSCERNGTRCVRLSRARALSLSLDPTSKNKRKKTNTIIKNAVRVRTRHALVTMLTCACVRYKRVASTFLRMLD